MADENPTITIADFRRVFCSRGTRRRMIEAGVNFEQFVKTGLPKSELMGKGFDPYIERIAEVKRTAEKDS